MISSEPGIEGTLLLRLYYKAYSSSYPTLLRCQIESLLLYCSGSEQYEHCGSGNWNRMQLFSIHTAYFCLLVHVGGGYFGFFLLYIYGLLKLTRHLSNQSVAESLSENQNSWQRGQLCPHRGSLNVVRSQTQYRNRAEVWDPKAVLTAS